MRYTFAGILSGNDRKFTVLPGGSTPRERLFPTRTEVQMRDDEGVPEIVTVPDLERMYPPSVTGRPRTTAEQMTDLFTKTMYGPPKKKRKKRRHLKLVKSRKPRKKR